MKKKFPTGKVIWLCIFFGVSSAFLATLSWMMYQDIRHAQASLNFIPVQATLIENNLLSKPDGKRLAIAYTYAIDGATYTGSRYKFGVENREFGEFSKHPAAKDIRRFHKQNPAGSQITVFVNPADPSDATVVRGHVYLWYEILALTLMTTMFGIGLYLTVFFPRWAAKNIESSDPS